MLNLNLNEPGWGYGVKFSGPIDFCIWVLETDGLRVPPFDQHPEGNKALRTRGLEAEALAVVANKSYTMSRSLARLVLGQIFI